MSNGNVSVISATKFRSMLNFRELYSRHQLKTSGAECVAEDTGREVDGICQSEPVDNMQRLKLYRSSRPDRLTAEEVEKFKNLNIRCIIDFRSAREYRRASGAKLLDQYYSVHAMKVSTKKTQKQRTTQIGTVNEPVIGKHFLINFFRLNYIRVLLSRAAWYVMLYSIFPLLYDVLLGTGFKHVARIYAHHVLNKGGLVQQYRDLVDYSHASICAGLKLLIDPSNVPAMFNCAHGKDRTGIMTALVLGCLGNSKSYIAADYARSEQELAPVQDRIDSQMIARFQLDRSFTTAKSETMMSLLHYIDDKYGSVSNYLVTIGFSLENQQQLRKNLTE